MLSFKSFKIFIVKYSKDKEESRKGTLKLKVCASVPSLHLLFPSLVNFFDY